MATSLLRTVKGLVMVGLLSTTGGSPAPASTVDQDRLDVVRSMQDSADAWSRNDLDGYMDGYERSPDTLYVTGSRIVRGYEAIRAMYASRFKPMQPLGHLSLVVIDYRPLSGDFSMALGRYVLARPGGVGPATGVFTLVYHRTLNHWKIISDHTSS